MRCITENDKSVICDVVRWEKWSYRLEQDITPKWRLRAEYFSGSDTTEIGVRYRIHEFLSAEYVYSNDKPYFRIVGNL